MLGPSYSFPACRDSVKCCFVRGSMSNVLIWLMAFDSSERSSAGIGFGPMHIPRISVSMVRLRILSRRSGYWKSEARKRSTLLEYSIGAQKRTSRASGASCLHVESAFSKSAWGLGCLTLLGRQCKIWRRTSSGSWLAMLEDNVS